MIFFNMMGSKLLQNWHHFPSKLPYINKYPREEDTFYYPLDPYFSVTPYIGPQQNDQPWMPNILGMPLDLTFLVTGCLAEISLK